LINNPTPLNMNLRLFREEIDIMVGGVLNTNVRRCEDHNLDRTRNTENIRVTDYISRHIFNSHGEMHRSIEVWNEFILPAIHRTLICTEFILPAIHRTLICTE